MWTQKNVSFYDAHYVKKKVRYKIFKEHVNDSDSLEGLDNQIDAGEDDIQVMGKEFWLDSLQDHEGADNTVTQFTLKEHMGNVRERYKGFDYELFHDTEDDFIGVVWHTATMRYNFKSFHACDTLDTMKRAINKCLWPCVSTFM